MATYGVPFTDYIPGSRDDQVAWTQVRVEEGATADGPWTEIDVISLLPIDDDPANPQPRSFTATHATLPSGWYLVTFLDGLGGEQPTFPIAVSAALATPSVRQVAGLLRSRTTDRNSGDELGTFTAETRPTHLEVDRLISEAAAHIGAQFPLTIGSDITVTARSTAALLAAVLIEQTYFPEQADIGAVAALERRLDLGLAGLERQIRAQQDLVA